MKNHKQIITVLVALAALTSAQKTYSMKKATGFLSESSKKDYSRSSRDDSRTNSTPGRGEESFHSRENSRSGLRGTDEEIRKQSITRQNAQIDGEKQRQIEPMKRPAKQSSPSSQVAAMPEAQWSLKKSSDEKPSALKPSIGTRGVAPQVRLEERTDAKLTYIKSDEKFKKFVDENLRPQHDAALGVTADKHEKQLNKLINKEDQIAKLDNPQKYTPISEEKIENLHAKQKNLEEKIFTSLQNAPKDQNKIMQDMSEKNIKIQTVEDAIKKNEGKLKSSTLSPEDKATIEKNIEMLKYEHAFNSNDLEKQANKLKAMAAKTSSKEDAEKMVNEYTTDLNKVKSATRILNDARAANSPESRIAESKHIIDQIEKNKESGQKLPPENENRVNIHKEFIREKEAEIQAAKNKEAHEAAQGLSSESSDVAAQRRARREAQERAAAQTKKKSGLNRLKFW